jgi:threonine dehydratase
MQLKEVEDSYKRIKPYIKHTPLIRCHSLEKFNKGKGRLYIKNEQEQETGSFKIRGVLQAVLAKAKDNLPFMARSSGNFGKALAYATKKLGHQAIIVIPENALPKKIQGAREYGAKVVVHGTTYQETFEKLEELFSKYQGIKLSSFDDLEVIKGQASIGVELLEDNSSFKYCFCPVGGGGVMAGCSFYLKEKDPSITMVGVEPKGSCSFALSFSLKKRITLPTTDTIADGLRTPFVGEHNWPLLSRYVDEAILVEDSKIQEAMRLIYEEHRIMLEPSGATSIAGWLAYVQKYPLEDDSICIATGGNIDSSDFFKIAFDNNYSFVS